MRAAAFGTRRIVQVCAVGAAALVLCPMTAGARPASAGAAAAGGTVLGGTTAQEYPIVLETNKGARKVLKARIAIHLTCTSGGGFTVWDGYRNLTLSKSRKFHASFGPETNANDDGTTYDLSGSMSGSFNKSRSKATGTWSLKEIDHDATGAVTDTCDATNVAWSAKQ